MNPWKVLLEGDSDLCVKGIIDISTRRYQDDLPEISLIANIITQAGKERDYEYFDDGGNFELHCYLLHLDPYEIYDVIKTIWKKEGDKNNVRWL